MNNCLVSIIVPIYGVEAYIEECVESLVNQTYNNIELIFVNDKTKDNSIEILKAVLLKYDISYILIEHLENQGLAAARNTGVKNAKGNFIINVDSDDSLDITAVETMVNAALLEKADIVLSDWLLIHEDGIVYSKIKYSTDKEEYFRKALMRSVNFSIAGKLLNRSLFDNVSFAAGINFGEDYLTFTQLLFYAKNISFVEKALYRYNKKNSNSYTSIISIESIKQLCNAQILLMKFCESKGVDANLMQNSIAQCIVHLIKTSRGNKECLTYIYDSLFNSDYTYDKLSFVDKAVYILFRFRFFSTTRVLIYLFDKMY